jgi:hypothetical protein
MMRLIFFMLQIKPHVTHKILSYKVPTPGIVIPALSAVLSKNDLELR